MSLALDSLGLGFTKAGEVVAAGSTVSATGAISLPLPDLSGGAGLTITASGAIQTVLPTPSGSASNVRGFLKYPFPIWTEE